MPPDQNEFKRHIIFTGRTTSAQYTSPLTGGDGFVIKQRNPSEHGQLIKGKLEAIQRQVELDRDGPLPENIVREDVIYLDFISDFDVELAFDSFEDNRSGKYHLLSSVREGKQFRA